MCNCSEQLQTQKVVFLVSLIDNEYLKTDCKISALALFIVYIYSVFTVYLQCIYSVLKQCIFSVFIVYYQVNATLDCTKCLKVDLKLLIDLSVWTMKW